MSSVGKLKKFTLPLIKRVYPALIASSLVGVQPLSGPTGLAHYIKYKHASNRKNQKPAKWKTKLRNIIYGYLRVKYRDMQVAKKSHDMVVMKLDNGKSLDIYAFDTEISVGTALEWRTVALSDKDMLKSVKELVDYFRDKAKVEC